jgi:diguanylate cyclase (GGDEF)-like protein
VVRDAAGQPRYWQGILLDITAPKELEEQLAHRAFHDPLTDLPNRALFNDRLEHALARAVRQRGLLAVLFLDLDDFKDVNDTFGHEAGDRMLIEVAQRVRSALRVGDSAARFGGDEFMVLLEDLEDRDEASRVAERLARVIAEPLEIEGREWRVSASIGVALSRGAEEPASELLRRADAEMYRVKVRRREG